MLEVKSVRVADPSSKFNPLTYETSKSFVSKERLFLSGLFENNSWACSNIISFFFPLIASWPFLSNLFSEFFLTQESIKQLL